MTSLLLCLIMPFFPAVIDVPSCSIEAQQEQCRCSECLAWDPVAEATWYEINRETVSNGSKQTIGQNVTVWIGEEPAEPFLSTIWCPAKDSSFPRESTLYLYRIRACNDYGCGSWSDPGIYYKAAPYACYENSGEVQCYVGARLRTR